MRMQGSFKLSPSKPCLITPNGIHTTTNSCHILTESHRRLKLGQLVTPNDIHTQQQTAVVMRRLKGYKTQALPTRDISTVEVNIAQPVAYQIELLTFDSF